MNKSKLVFLLVIVLLSSCQNEPVFLLSEEVIDEEVIDEEVIDDETEEASAFETGGICIGNGEYGIDTNNLLLNFEVPTDMPSSFDLSSLLPPIRSQGQQGSCVSWAISYYMKSLQEKIEFGMDFTTENVTSPAYTYNQITQGNCTGTQLVETLELLKNKGVCTWSSFPYLDTDCNTQPGPAEDDQALQNRISDYKCLSGDNMVNEMKGLINQQTPIITSAYLSSEFGKVDNFGLTAYREHVVDYSLERCHAMLVVGYSDNYNAFKVVNSWGTDWGDDGFVWIDYAAFENVTDDTAAFRVINQAYVAYDIE